MPPRLILRLEGLALATAALALYAERDYSWLLLAVLVLAPDISFLGYLAGPRIGAGAYNVVHTLVGPFALATAALLADWDSGIQIAAIWVVHIGVDRMLGYGLKYPSAFKDTHLQRV
jgi:uncharacterized protein DUF4260